MIDIIGQKFNKLTVLRLSDRKEKKRSFKICLCDCGNEVEVRTDQLKSGHTKSCGCFKKEKLTELKSNQTGELCSWWKGGKPKCLGCNKEVTSYKGRYCKSCFGIIQAKIMKENPLSLGLKRTNEHRIKMSLAHGGTGDLMQRGYSNKYGSNFTLELKTKIRQRSNNRCFLCDQKEFKKRLQVHHIDYNKLNCDENNLVALCTKCHCQTNRNRETWKRYFQGIFQTISVANGGAISATAA